MFAVSSPSPLGSCCPRSLATQVGSSACLLILSFWLTPVTAGAQGTPALVSVDSSGTRASAGSQGPSIGGDGTNIVFHSDATNLVPGDTNGRRDIFLRDTRTGTTSRVNLTSGGDQATGSSENAAISRGGRYVAFQSKASNLVPGDTNGSRDIFVHDTRTGVTSRVSVSSAGAQSNGHSYFVAMSDDGRYVAFDSVASNLVPDDTNGRRDIFVHDRETGQTTRASVSSEGLQGNSETLAFSLSGNGRYVAFESAASNLVPDDTNGRRDIFVHDLQTGITRRVNISSSGAQANNSSENPSLSYDRYVAFESHAWNLVDNDLNRVRDIFVHDLQTGITRRASVSSAGVEANQASAYASMSSDGRYVAFRSNASNLAPGATGGLGHIYVHDLWSGATSLVITDPVGRHSDSSQNFIPRLSGDGLHLAFESDTATLVPDDTNGVVDVFVIGAR